MFKTKAELIADLKAKNASKEDIAQMQSMTPEDLVNAGLIEGKQVDVASKGVNVTSESIAPESTDSESEDGFLDLPIEDKQEPIITKDEFNIFKGDDVEDRVSDLINSKLASKNITVRPAMPGSDAIEVTNSVGANIVIPLYTEDNTTGALQYPVENADQPYEDFINFISQPVDQKQADIYSKTRLKAEKDGLYNVEIQQNYDKLKLGSEESPVVYSADADQVLQITEFTENEINKAFTSISVDGLDINYPGLEAQYSSFNLQNIPHDTEEAVKKAVYEQVSKRFREEDGTGRRNFTYDEFLKILGGRDTGLFRKTLNNLAAKQQQQNNRKALSEIDVNKDFIQEQNENFYKSLNEKEKRKAKYVIDLKKARQSLREAEANGDSDAITQHQNTIDGILKDIKINAQTSASMHYDDDTYEDKRLASSFFKDSEMSDYRAENATKAAQSVENTLSTLLAALQDSDPSLSDEEALMKYYEAKTVRYQQLMKEGDNLKINLNVNELNRALRQPEEYKGELYDLLAQIRKSSGKASLWSHEGYSEGKIEISLNDIFNAGLDARDFNGIFDIMKGIISKKDLNLLNQYEATRDENLGERRALYELLFLDTDPKEMKRESGLVSFARQTGQAIMTSWFDKSSRQAQLFFGAGDLTQRAIKDYISSSLDDYNVEFAGTIDPFTGAEFQPIQLTDEQIENITRSFSEEVGEGVGDFTPMLIELAGINAATGGILSWGQVGRIYQMFRTGTKTQKLAWHGFNAMLEEGKMQVAFDMPATGGFTFYTLGALTEGVTPFKKKFAFLNPLYQKTLKTGVVGATSLRAAEITELAYEAFMSEKDFASEFNDMYPEGVYSLAERKLLVDMMVFGITGFSHIKKTDFYTTGAKVRMIDKLAKENDKMIQDALPMIEGKKLLSAVPDVYMNPEKYLSPKLLKKYNQNIEFGKKLEAAYRLDRQHIDLDPTNPKFEQNFRKEKLDPVNENLRKLLGPDFVPIKVEFSSDRSKYETDKNGKDKGNIAEFKPESNTILLDKNNFGVGNSKWNHEVTHAILHAHFKNNPQAKVNFLRNIKTILRQFDFKAPDGSKLAEAIDFVYRDKSEGVKTEEFMAHVVEILSNPSIYNQKRAANVWTDIKQEFMGIAENYGYNPKIKTGQDLLDAVGRVANQQTTPDKLLNLTEVPMKQIETGVVKNEIIESSTYGSRDLNQTKLSLEAQKQKKISQNVDANTRLKELKKIKPDLLSKNEKAEIKELETLIQTNITELKPINEQIKVTEQNIKNNEVNKKYIPEYKKLAAEKQAQLEPGGVTYEKIQKLKKLKKEFPEGSSEITRLENEIRENKLPGGKEQVFQRAGNELYKNNEKIVNEFIRKSYEAGGEISKTEFESAVRLEVAKIYKSYDPIKNDNFGIYLRQSLFGKNYKYEPIGKDAAGNPIWAKPQRLGNVLELAQTERMGGESKTGEKVTFTGTEVLETMQDVSGGVGRDAYIQGTNYSIGEGKLVVDILKGQIPDVALKEVKRNITKDGIKIDGKVIKFNDLTYNNLTNLVTKSTAKDIFGKNYKEKAEYIFKNWDKIQQILPKNLNTITGEAGIVETVLLDAHYKSAAESKRIDITQGNIEGVGNTLRELRPQTQEQFLSQYRLKIDKDGKLDLSGLETKGKSPEEVLQIRAVIRKIGLLEGQITRALTNQVVRQEIADRVQNGDINLGKKVGIQTVMNQIRSGKNDILASRELTTTEQQLTNLEKSILNHKGEISMITVYQMMEMNNIPVKDRKRIGGILGDIITQYDAKNLTKEQVKKGLEIEKQKELSEVELKEMEYVDQKNYDKLTDYLNKKYPGLKLTKDVYGKLGENPITVEEMRAIDAQLIAIFPEGMPKSIDAAILEQSGVNQRRKIDGKRINMSRDMSGKTSVDLTIEAITGGSRGNNGKKYKGEYDAVNITDPGKFKTALRKFRENYKGNDLNGDLYDFARDFLTKKGINPKTKKPYTFEETFAANEKLRTDYITGMYEILRKTPKNEQGKIVQGFLRHFQMQTNHGTGISKGTFTFTGISNMLGEVIPGKSSSGYHAEHKLQLQNYHANVIDAMLRNINNPKQFQKELEILNRDAQQTITQYTDKMRYDAAPYGGQSGNIDKATGKASYDVGAIKADITYLIERPGIASETVNLLGPRGKTLADKIINNATKKDISQALSEIKKENWSADVYSLEYRNNSRELHNPPEVKAELEFKNEIANKEVVMPSRDLGLELNKILEGNFNIKAEATYSDAKAKVISDRRKWYKGLSQELFVGSRASDFKDLTNYRLVNKKGKEGEAQQKFFNDHLHIPYAMGVNALNVAKNRIQTEYKNLNKQFPNIKKILNKDIPGEIFSNANAVRVYLWTKSGYNMLEYGLSKKDLKKLNDTVTNNPELQAYADQLGLLSGVKEGYVKPDAFWLTQGIHQDLAGITSGKNRENYLSEFNTNVDIIFSKANLNKLQTIHGLKYREALENAIYRMKTGSNKVFSKTDKIMNEFNDWTNGAVGVTMFLNTRSAVLQTLSTANYIDWGANNPINAAKAFANQPQYWKDFAMIWNSPMMKQRRGGLQTDVNFNELAGVAKKGGVRGVTSKLLQLGFAPTIIADNFAISAGGATFYRNTFNKHLKNGLSVKEAEKLTWNEFQERTQTTQQSSDPSKISQVQASGLGRLVFAFQNTPMQYTREMKKSILDLTYNRGDAKHNISKILYYGAVQNLIFGSLQNALFTAAFDDNEQKFDTKTGRILNGMFDSVLRGSGLPGAIFATTKNTLMKFAEEEKKGFNADHAQTLIQAANFAPPIGIKARKLYTGMRTYQLNKDIIPHMGLSINNPAYSMIGNITAATTNFPLDAAVRKSYNIQQVISGDIEWWQRVSLAAGYRPWDVGVEDPEVIEVEKKVKEEKKEKKKQERKEKEKVKKAEEEKKKIEINTEKQKEQKKKGEQVTCLKCNRPVVKGKTLCTVHEKKEQRKDGKEVRCSLIYPKGHKKAGQQCGVMTTNKSGLCPYHD